MGGFTASFLGGPMHGKGLWLVNLEPVLTISQFGGGVDNFLGAMKRGDVVLDQQVSFYDAENTTPDSARMKITSCEYTLMPFFAAGGKFLYIAFEDGDLES